MSERAKQKDLSLLVHLVTQGGACADKDLLTLAVLNAAGCAAAGAGVSAQALPRQRAETAVHVCSTNSFDSGHAEEIRTECADLRQLGQQQSQQTSGSLLPAAAPAVNTCWKWQQ